MKTLEKRGEHLHTAGCMVFWAEGSRHRNDVTFVNSDPAMIALFVRFLRHYFDPPERSLKLRARLAKSTVNRYSRASKRTRINKLPYGTCRLTFHSTRTVQHIYGAIQAYGGFERPEWLD